MLLPADSSCDGVTALSMLQLIPPCRVKWSGCVGWALCGHSAAPEADHADAARDSASQPTEAVAAEAISDSPGAHDRPPGVIQHESQHASLRVPEHPAVEDCSEKPSRRAGSSIPRAEKQAVGMMCKQLLDCSRLLWLRQHGFEVCSAKPSHVSM